MTTTGTVTPDRQALSDRLSTGLSAVESRLTAVVQHDDEFITGASRHLLTGGKRFRPLLTLLAAELGDTGITDSVTDAAVGVELTHIASLYHDDVMDTTEQRHGIPSVNAAYDNCTAIIVGDLLCGRASELLAGLGNEVTQIHVRTMLRLCTGQIRDSRPVPASADPMEHYFGVIADKTGALIAAAARYGALCAGCPAETVEIMRQYGEYVGMVFQLSDDILDITSDGATGKTPGTDLREGIATLPVLYARASTDPADAPLQQLLSHPLVDETERREALGLLRTHPSLQQARQHAESFAARAVAVLEPLPDSAALDVLKELPWQVAYKTDGPGNVMEHAIRRGPEYRS